MLGLLALIYTVDSYSMPKYQALLTPSFSNSLVCCFEEANKHCNGTRKEFHFVPFSPTLPQTRFLPTIKPLNRTVGVTL
jgi:hypothetical protein